MKFNVQRVLTPAYLTSIALVVVGVVLALAWYPEAAWLFVLAGLALNAMAVSVTAINDSPRAPGRVPRRRPSLSARGARAGGHDTELAEDRADDVDGVRPAGEPGHHGFVEPEAETDATPTVPHTGSRPLEAPRGG